MRNPAFIRCPLDVKIVLGGGGGWVLKYLSKPHKLAIFSFISHAVQDSFRTLTIFQMILYSTLAVTATSRKICATLSITFDI